MGAAWGRLETLGCFWGAPRVLLECSSEPPWKLLGSSWAFLVSSRGLLGGSWVLLGDSLGALGDSLGALGDSLGALGNSLGTTWELVGAPSSSLPLVPALEQLGPFAVPGTLCESLPELVLQPAPKQPQTGSSESLAGH